MNLLYWARQGRISLQTPDDTASARVRATQSGQTLVLFAIFFTVILGAAALVLDQGMLRKANMDLANSLDSGALAGVPFLPDDTTTAEQVAREYVQLNTGLASRQRRRRQLPLPHRRQGQWPAAADRRPRRTRPGQARDLDGRRRHGLCQVSAGAGPRLQRHPLTAPAEVDYSFAPALGVDSGSTGARWQPPARVSAGRPRRSPSTW